MYYLRGFRQAHAADQRQQRANHRHGEHRCVKSAVRPAACLVSDAWPLATKRRGPHCPNTEPRSNQRPVAVSGTVTSCPSATCAILNSHTSMPVFSFINSIRRCMCVQSTNSLVFAFSYHCCVCCPSSSSYIRHCLCLSVFPSITGVCVCVFSSMYPSTL